MWETWRRSYVKHSVLTWKYTVMIGTYMYCTTLKRLYDINLHGPYTFTDRLLSVRIVYYTYNQEWKNTNTDCAKNIEHKRTWSRICHKLPHMNNEHRTNIERLYTGVAKMPQNGCDRDRSLAWLCLRTPNYPISFPPLKWGILASVGNSLYHSHFIQTTANLDLRPPSIAKKISTIFHDRPLWTWLLNPKFIPSYGPQI